jgi:hypothetical protein
MRLYESKYRLAEREDVLAKLNATLQSLDQRTDAIELLAEAFRTGNRYDVDALVRLINDDWSSKSLAMQQLLDENAGGFTPDRIAETAAKRFTSDAEIGGLTAADAAAVAALALKAPLASPTLSGTPTAPTPAVGTNTGQIATAAHVKASIDALVASSPATLDTLNELAAALGNDANYAATVAAALANRPNTGFFRKLDPDSVAFLKTGAGTASIKAGTIVEVAGTIVAFAIDTAITMPALTAGTDYAVWVKDDGTIQADASFTVVPGAGNWRKIGGFHYAPGGNATPRSKAAVPAGTAIGAQTVPINTWALYLLSVSSAGAITVTPAAANATTGYASEALAIAAMPAIPAGNALMGYVTVQTKTGTTWIANTDSLAGGAGGNVANATNYYPASGAAMGLTLSRGSTNQRIASTAFTYWLGGDTTPAINPYSLWDLKWRPACSDPRGMALVAGAFWADIYLCGVNHITDGTSKNGVTIADGSSPPKIPTEFGGNGTTAYTTLTWWEAGEVMKAHGKRLLSYADFAAAAFGVTENAARGNDPVTTGIATTNAGSSNADQKFTSKWGIMQASGGLWVWGSDFAVNADSTTWGWYDQANGRGQIYERGAGYAGYLTAALFGGFWVYGANCGSRCSGWNLPLSASYDSVGARGRCDHLRLV